MKIWGPNAEEFDPTRFLDADGKYLRRMTSEGADQYCRQPNLVPFALGKRECLGKTLADREYFLFFTGLLNVFEFRKVEVNIQLETAHLSKLYINLSYLIEISVQYCYLKNSPPFREWFFHP